MSKEIKNYKQKMKVLEKAVCVNIREEGKTLLYEFKAKDEEGTITIDESKHKFAKNYIINALKTKKFNAYREKSRYKNFVPEILNDSDKKSTSSEEEIIGSTGGYDVYGEQLEFSDAYDTAEEIHEKRDERRDKESDGGSDKESEEDVVECVPKNPLRIDLSIERVQEQVLEDIVGFKVNKFNQFIGIQPTTEGFKITLANLRGERKIFNIGELDLEQLGAINVGLISFIYRKGLI